MTISEETRHHLYLRLEAVLGAEEAATLMEHLPPVGWADVATKRDVDGLAVATKRDIEGLEMRSNARLERELRLMTWRLVTVVIAVGSLVIAGVRL